MKAARILSAAAIAALASSVGAHSVSAWGNGDICYQQQTYHFTTEQTYYAFLGSHHGATEGTCIPKETTTSTTSPSTTAATSSPATTQAPSSTVLTVTQHSTDSSTPSSPPASSPPGSATPTTVPQPGEMCNGLPIDTTASNFDVCETTSSTRLPGAGGPSTQRPAPPQTPSSLPSTGAADTAVKLGIGALLLAIGGTLAWASKGTGDE